MRICVSVVFDYQNVELRAVVGQMTERKMIERTYGRKTYDRKDIRPKDF